MIDDLLVLFLTQYIRGIKAVSYTIKNIQLSRAIFFIQIILEDVRGVTEKRNYIRCYDGMDAGDVVVDHLFFKDLTGCNISIEKEVVRRNLYVIVFIKEVSKGKNFKLPVLTQFNNVVQGLID